MSTETETSCVELARVIAFPYEPTLALINAIKIFAESVLTAARKERE